MRIISLMVLMLVAVGLAGQTPKDRRAKKNSEKYWIEHPPSKVFTLPDSSQDKAPPMINRDLAVWPQNEKPPNVLWVVEYTVKQVTRQYSPVARTDESGMAVTLEIRTDDWRLVSTVKTERLEFPTRAGAVAHIRALGKPVKDLAILWGGDVVSREYSDVRLWRAEEIPVTEKVVVEKVPQPPTEKHTVTWDVK